MQSALFKYQLFSYVTDNGLFLKLNINLYDVLYQS
jgi:hypothetical protein